MQGCIDLAVMLCVGQGWGSPDNYAEAFQILHARGLLSAELTTRMVRAVGFRDAVMQSYESLDMQQTWRAASKGSDDLREFLRSVGPIL